MMKQRDDMNIIIERTKRFCGYIVGIVFFVSGVLKLLDPVGTGLIVEEYYKFLHLGFLSFSAKPVAVMLALTESLLGAALITGLWRKVIAVAVLLFMGFFTLVSVALLVFNPVMDCGCFGEAVHLTHFQTFVKNLVLDALCCASFFPFSALGRPRKRKYVAFSMVTAGLAVFTVYSLVYIPLLNFTDYSVSARLEASERHIARAMDSEDEYEAIFIYEKDGRVEEFTLENLPDSTWNFVSTETVKKERPGLDEASISLPVIDGEGKYHDELAAGEKVMVVSVYAPESLPLRKWAALSAYLEDASAGGFRPLLLVAASPESGREILDRIGKEGTADMDFLRSVFYYSDYKALISLNRSNGGATYFSEGFLVRKWAFKALPGRERLVELGTEDPTEPLLSYGTVGNLSFQAFLLYSFAVMLLL